MRSIFAILLLVIFVSCFGSFSEGERYFHQADYESAISEFSKTLFLNVTDVKSLHLRARSYEELEEFDKAVEDYKTIIHYDPTYAQAYAGIGKLFWKREDYKNAQKYLLLAAKEDGKDYEILFLLGRAMLMNEEYRSADEFLQLAKELNPKDSRVYFYQGMARSQIGDILGAAGSFTMCLRHDPENTTAKYNRGLILLLLGNSDWALEDFEDVLKANPNHIEAMARRGNAKLDINDPTGCKDIREAAKKGSVYAQMNLGRCE
ncbi:tetratricopeptide repeat protein [Aquiflexum sp. TKW24L]|uniref:tetratricopeptide repeat protein n=1 Tax=Aquiflexum sp. TKW24L TaxID=2942212 RepID=UPI0020C105B9|nr:tetratricopeptide repeat protein [Aquiflexum sp. TKW24L]MCL6260161.1 tetratricopeptide repeat protein [Aquiflexum sp. TKW24L]